MTIKTNSIDCPELSVFSALSEAQLTHINEPDEGLFIAESKNVIERALAAGYEPVSALCSTEAFQKSGLSGRLGDIPVYLADETVLKGITGYNLTGGLLCAMRRKRLPEASEICKGARRIAVLEDVVNPTNIGAIFRSAAAMGIDAVLLTPACADPLYRRAIRVSMGNVFLVPWTYVTEDEYLWRDRGVSLLHELGFKAASLALKDDTLDIRDPRLLAEERLALLLGTEGAGLSDRTISASDYTVKIPMTNGVDSLNVAAASAVAFWEISMRNT